MKKRRFIIGFIAMVLGILSITGGPKKAKAEIKITDCFSVTGFFRHELAVHTGESNPNNVLQDDNHDFSLSRTWFQTEWTYQPSDKFQIFSKIRLMSDQTEDIDSNLNSYDAFPLDVPEYDWTMLKVSDDKWRGEIWELYADIMVGKLWLRLGKQQIAWGEMIGARLMDIINSVDYSRNFILDPEEFEHIRIPNWMIRVRYEFGPVMDWLNDVSIEGFVNPGDVVPNFMGDSGSPFNIMPAFPGVLRMTEKDRRGETEYGIRVGGMIGTFYLTLNYLYVYSDDPAMQFTGLSLRPFRFLIDMEYPATDIYGLTCNYFIGPLNTVVTFEGRWTPNQPYQEARRSFWIKDQGTWSYAVQFMRPTFVFPRPTSAMTIQVQFQQTIREGDEDKILGPGFSKVDKNEDLIAVVFDQYFCYNDYQITLQLGYDPDDAWLVKPMFKYNYKNKWFFDVYYASLSGSEKRTGRIGSLSWADEVVGRITYQF